MATNLTGSLFSAYTSASRYDQVLGIPLNTVLPSGTTSLGSFLLDNYLLTVGSNSTVRR